MGNCGCGCGCTEAKASPISCNYVLDAGADTSSINFRIGELIGFRAIVNDIPVISELKMWDGSKLIPFQIATTPPGTLNRGTAAPIDANGQSTTIYPISLPINTPPQLTPIVGTDGAEFNVILLNDYSTTQFKIYCFDSDGLPYSGNGVVIFLV